MQLVNATYELHDNISDFKEFSYCLFIVDLFFFFFIVYILFSRWRV